MMTNFTGSERSGGARPSSAVAVIIAAYNVAETIGKAVRTALAQPQTAEVVVVDDASQDDTGMVARKAAAGDPRLMIIRNQENVGPARSRNIAMRQTMSPYIAILDGDDYYLDGRFAQIFAQLGWDFCADNIIFFTDADQIAHIRTSFDSPFLQPLTVDLRTFVAGNIPDAKRPRAELGFLKPVMRRAFLDQHGLAYPEECRLGEDFLFYSQALAKGAVYKALPQCGYAALVRENSLSGQHSVIDLKLLYAREMAMAASEALAPDEQALFRKRARSTLRRIHHREVLASKAEGGKLRGIAAGLSRPTSFVDIVRDRLRKSGFKSTQPLPRTLLPASCFSNDINQR